MSERILVVGDIHGLFENCEDLIADVVKTEEAEGRKIDKIIQVGDFGCYPFCGPHYERDCNLPAYTKIPAYFIRGNHEDHEFLKRLYHDPEPVTLVQYPGWKYVPDGVEHEGVFYIGGAWSIDAAWRNRADHPRRWHENEQIDNNHINKILDFFHDPEKINALKLIITHDAPLQLYPLIVNGLLSRADYKTPRLFDRLVELLNTHLTHEITWCFGHLGKSHMNPSSARHGTPAKFKIGKVNFFLLDMIQDYKENSHHCDSFTIVEV